MIESDETYRVKTLLIILLFYHSPPGSNCILDLKYQDDCKRFLKNGRFKEWIDKIGSISTDNLYGIAKDFEEKLFLKHLTMHQVYLDGIRDYFIGNYCEIAIPHFPLDILRLHEFQDMQENCLEKVVERFKNEIFNNNISETLTCKLFEDSEFQSEFCKKLQEGKTFAEVLKLTDVSDYPLPIIFWTKKYGLTLFSKKLWKFVEKEFTGEEKLLQFYLALFGECCKIDESYIKCSKDSLTSLAKLKSLVSNFKTQDKKNILHLLISSGMSDYDTHRCLTKVLEDVGDVNVTIDRDLLLMALTHKKCSRLLCIIEILNQLEDRSNTTENEFRECLFDPMNEALWELEWVVRICSVSSYDEKQPKIACVNFCSKSKDHQYLNDLLCRKSDMVSTIRSCMNACKIFHTQMLPNVVSKPRIQFRKGINVELRKLMEKSFEKLSKLDDLSLSF